MTNILRRSSFSNIRLSSYFFIFYYYEPNPLFSRYFIHTNNFQWAFILIKRFFIGFTKLNLTLLGCFSQGIVYLASPYQS